MCLLQMVSCIRSCIWTVQSYDESSIPASDFRPGAALFPACRAVGLPQRVCTLACVLQGTRNACPSVGLEREAGRPFLLPNWKKFATQLGRNFSPVRQQRTPVLCPERSLRSAFRRCDLGCKTPILSTNQPFLYTNSESTSRARDILVFINAKFHCFSLIISSPGLKTG